jgi:succinylglutamate desuccinylase
MNGASEIPALIQKLRHTEVRQIFNEPTLIEIPGKSDEWVFLCTLLHGNEPASFEVLKLLQKHLETHELKRSLMIFVGNVEAAEKNKRRLKHQEDYNRVWMGGDSPEHQLANEVIQKAKTKKLFASLDVHNNTGTNPFYACINKKKLSHLKLASLFGNQVVFFETPGTVQSMAFSNLCPAITVECGRPENPHGPVKAFELLLTLLNMDEVPEHVADAKDLQVYETQGRLLVDPDKLKWPDDFEHWNFRTLPAGFQLAETSDTRTVEVRNVDEKDITGEYIQFEGNAVYLKKEMIPAMLTSNKEVVRQDCLGYLMKPLDWQSFSD